MARFKPSLDERRYEAINQSKIQSIMDKEEICNILKKALEEAKLQGNVLMMNPKDVNYEQIKSKYKTKNTSDIIFIQFTNDGHIAVVGAGKDMSFSKNNSYGTWGVISEIDDVEWDYDTVIIIPIINIKNCKIKKGENILKYRNGVEQYLGDYLLLEKKVPILNCYQHKNYSDSFWSRCKENGYII